MAAGVFYESMVLGAGGTPVRVRVEPTTFDLDVDGIEAALTPRTRVVLINTPNNPTGRIYPAATFARLADALRRRGGSRDRPVYLLSDESYSKVLFDGHRMVSPAAFYERTLLVHTYSKNALAPAQRLGYLAPPPSMPGRARLRPLGWRRPTRSWVESSDDARGTTRVHCGHPQPPRRTPCRRGALR